MTSDEFSINQSLRIIVNTEAELPSAARKLLASCPGGRIFALFGEMGVGKTTFIKALCHELGVTEIVQSPTFSIINEYKTTSGGSIYHFDLYRLNNIREVFDIGYEDYLFSGSYCFIEWPELIESLLPPAVVRVRISGDEVRVIETEISGQDLTILVPFHRPD